ncbi:hypothetical protein G3I44_06610 [Halogeometricum borinquense]|uniref:Uncharacterized protein n=1 Tax=Halogeometricum borinquense TaxID=60847 RepID=A0A6C0UEY3_9EURY|nr:hypothetical protein [Halogeometricum borinquense]QIB73992.1 hypothetical protein G3I44_06610 [Halogeometricum borinquense]
MRTRENETRAWELVQYRDGRMVVLGLGWWTAALSSIALADIPPTNWIAGIIVFGATVFGAACAVTAPFRLGRSLVAWTGGQLLVATVAFGGIALAGRTLLYPTTPATIVYTQTPVEVPATVAASVGSFLALYIVGRILRTVLRRGWTAIDRVQTVQRRVFAGRTKR